MLHGFWKRLWGHFVPAAVLIATTAGIAADLSAAETTTQDRRYMKIPFNPKTTLDGKKKIPLRIPMMPST